MNSAYFSNGLTHIPYYTVLYKYAFKAKGILCYECRIHKFLLYAFTYEPTILQYIFTDHILTLWHLSDAMYEKIQKLTVSGALISLQGFFSPIAAVEKE